MGGFSLVELVVASLLLLMIILGATPLFIRSISSNTGGNDYTQLSNSSKSQVEELFQLDFNSSRLSIPPGQKEVEIDEYWSKAEKKWKPGPAPAGETPPWTRTTVVRQFSIAAVDNSVDTFDFESSSALDGGEGSDSIHLKEIAVTVESSREGPLGPRRDLVLRTLKAK